MQGFIPYSFVLVGKTSLSKVMFGERFNAAERPTQVADIGSRVAEINYKQTNSWRFSRTIESDAANRQKSFEDHVSSHIFLYMHKKRQQRKQGYGPDSETKGEGGNLTDSPPNTGSHGGTPTSPLSDYVKIDLAPSPASPLTFEGGSPRVQPEYFISDMSTGTFSDLLKHVIPQSQLENILCWWPKRKKLAELPMLNHALSDGPLGHTLSVQKRSCLMCVSEFCGEPILINLFPLLFAPVCAYLITYDVSAEEAAAAWCSAGLRTVDATALTKEEVLVEWLCSCMASAGTHDQLQLPIILPSVHPRLPVMLVLLTKTDKEYSHDMEVQLDKVLRENIPSVRLHRKSEPQTPGHVLYSTSSRKGEQERKYLLRDVETIACRSVYSFAQHIPHSWSKMYNYLINTHQSRKKAFIFVEHLHKLMCQLPIAVDRTTLEVALRYFHGLGCICFFHRHPQLRCIVFLQPQILLDAMASILLQPDMWEFESSRQLYLTSLQQGIVERRLLYDIYDTTSHSLDFKLVLYVLDAMNILCKHPLLDTRNPQLVVPCLVKATGKGFFPHPATDSSNGMEAEWLVFEAHEMQFPWAAYNQLVTCCCRSALHYKPQLWQRMAHIQLTNTCHLVMAHEGKKITFRVESNSSSPCDVCILHTVDNESQASIPSSDATSSSVTLCGTPQMATHSGGEQDLSDICTPQSSFLVANSKGIRFIEWAKTIKTDTPKADLPGILDDLLKAREPNVQSVRPLVFPVNVDDLSALCPPTLDFLQSQLDCIRQCWFPGLQYHLRPKHWRPLQGDEQGPILDRQWMLENQRLPHTPQCLRLWWKAEQ